MEPIPEMDMVRMHYQKTADAWLQNMDREARTIRDIFDRHYQNDGDRWFFGGAFSSWMFPKYLLWEEVANGKWHTI